MIRLLLIAAVLVWLIPPIGGMVGNTIELGYQMRESNVRLAASTGAEIVTAEEFAKER